MFAYVKYLDDNVCKTVPISFVNEFNKDDWSTRFIYRVFWSPKEIDSPTTNCVDNFAEDGSGFYKAIILKLAASREEMAETIEKSRIKYTSTKLIEDRDIGAKTTDIDMKKQESKALKQMKTQANLFNNQELLNLTQNCEASNASMKNTDNLNRKRCSRKTLFPDLSESDESVDNSDDDVVPKKMYKELEKKYDDLKRKEYEKYKSLNNKYQKIKEKVEKLSDLNLRLQTKLLHPNSNPTPPTRTTTPMFSPKTPTSSPKTLITDKGDGPTTPKTDYISSITTTEEIDNGSAFAHDSISSVSTEKLLLAKQVKRGRAGDSQFAKNLTTIFWDEKTLENRSVTGRKSNAVKHCTEAKKMLTPQKMDHLRKLFKDRILEENPNISADEMIMRCNNINQYVAQKIATLNRKVITSIRGEQEGNN